MIHCSETTRVAVIGGDGDDSSCVGTEVAKKSKLPLYTPSTTTVTDASVTLLQYVMEAMGDMGYVITGDLARIALHSKQVHEPDVIIDLDSAGDVEGDYLLLDNSTPHIYLHSQSPMLATVFPLRNE